VAPSGGVDGAPVTVADQGAVAQQVGAGAGSGQRKLGPN